MKRKKPDKKLKALARIMDGSHFLPGLRGFVRQVLQLLEKLIRHKSTKKHIKNPIRKSYTEND